MVPSIAKLAVISVALRWPTINSRRVVAPRARGPVCVESLDADEAASRLSSGAAALIDCRQPAEFRLDGRVEGSVNIPAFSWEHGFHLPVEEFAATVADEFAADSSLVLIHSLPALAAGAANVLEAAGFSNVAVCEGGISAWDPDGIVVDDDEGLVGAWV